MLTEFGIHPILESCAQLFPYCLMSATDSQLGLCCVWEVNCQNSSGKQNREMTGHRGESYLVTHLPWER